MNTEVKTINSIKLSDFDKICRTCLESQHENKMISLDIELIQMLEECSAVQKSYQSKFPQQLCDNCLWQLRTAYEFKQQAISAFGILCQILREDEYDTKENETTLKDTRLDSVESKFVPQIKEEINAPCCDDIKDSYHFSDDAENCLTNNADLENDAHDKDKSEQRQQSLAEMLVKKYNIYDLTCNICQKVLSTRSTLLRHMETHDTNRALKFTCTVCSKAFSDKGNLNKHINRHEGKANYKCDKCPKSYYELSALAKHAKIRHKVAPLKCMKCAQEFYHQLQLDAHDKNTHQKKQFMCDICGKIFLQKYHLNLHKSKHSDYKPYICTICNNSFKHKFTLKTHIQLRHVDPERRDICTVCGKLIHPGSMYQHLETHKDGTFKCPDCNKVYTNKYVMHTHRKQVHISGGPPKRHICEYCKKPYPYQSSLRTHIEMVHSGPKERRFTCHLCDKSYTRQGLVNAHIRRAHMNEKTHTCPTCNKAFYTKSEWTKHNRSHTGERPFSCTVCGKAFGFRNVLNTHLKIHAS